MSNPGRQRTRATHRIARSVALTLAACLASNAATPASAQPAPAASSPRPALDELLAKGDALFDAAKYQDAVAVYRDADSLYPDNAKVQLSLAAAYAELGRRDEGMAALDRAVQLDPERLRDAAPVAALRARLQAMPAPEPVVSADTALAVRSAEMVLAKAKGQSDEEAIATANKARDLLSDALAEPEQNSLQVWRLSGVIAVITKDTDLGAYAFEAIERLKPDYHLDDSLLDLMAELKVMGVDSRATEIRGSRSHNLEIRESWEVRRRNNDPESYFKIGNMFRVGQGVPINYKKAHEYYQRAIDGGIVQAINNLGYLYRYGLGCARDPARALSLFAQASEHGVAEADFNLGQCYRNGIGVTADIKKAEEYLLSAIERGSIDAMTELGSMLATEQSIEHDYERAMFWFQKAADAGNSLGMAYIGWMYQFGRGVPQDSATAKDWYQKAARAGNQWAKDQLSVQGIGW